MDTIVVNKAQLIKTLAENRDAHRDIFEQAQVAYRDKWITLLDRRLADARAGRPIERHFRLPEPEDHTQDFTTALEMLDWETGDEVELDRRDFQRYVQNRWEWEQSFVANTQSYVGGEW